MRRIKVIFTILLAVLPVWCGRLWARPTTAEEAERVVTGWRKGDARPLGAALGRVVTRVETFTNSTGEPIYYIVNLAGGGFVIVPADDLIEPIIGFVDAGTYDPSPDNPLGALVSSDLRGRIAAVRGAQGGQAGVAAERTLEAQAKWERLQSLADGVVVMGLGSVPDLRIAPLVKSKWDQRTCCLSDPCACYNYYTPRYAEGSVSNYRSGCVATALAQIMRYHLYPNIGIGKIKFDIKVDNIEQERYTCGGDGNGGAYGWANMVLVPGCGTTLTQRKAIGALCHDAGVGISNLVPSENEYTNYKSDVTTAFTHSAKVGLISTFKYGNAIMGYNNGYEIGAGLINMINPSLDYGHPVYLGIKKYGTSVGHAVVCDGYGYDTGTLYHHINMGWGGTSDAWYLLPDITTTYDTIYETIYNISPWAMKEIISGRVTTPDGTPIAGVEVHGDSYDCFVSSIDWTDANGIYAIDAESGCNYTVSVSKSGYFFGGGQDVNVGRSVDSNAVSGNRWGINFECIPPEITSITPDCGPAGSYVRIEGQYFGSSEGKVRFWCFPAGPPWGEEVQWSNTVIYCRVPQYVLSGDVIVRTAVGLDSNGVHFEPNDPAMIYVDANNITKMENGTTEYPFSKVQRGIHAATGGDTVIAAAGTYYENINLKGKYITLTGTDPNDPNVIALTVIDGNDSGTVVVFDSNEDANCLLTGFTITDGNSEWDGGGIYCFHSSPTISRCVITNNFSARGGGGIRCIERACPVISYCTVIENSVGSNESGGGICLINDSNAIMSHCVISDNIAGYGGGGMCNNYSNPILTNCTFINNSMTDEWTYGGGINNYSSSPVLTNCSFISNSASWEGGGIYNNYNSDSKLRNCTFTKNSAGSKGGGMTNFISKPTVIECIFNENSAGSGGGVYHWDSTAKLISCTFTANSAGNDGGGVLNEYANPALTNCTFAGNTAVDDGGAMYNHDIKNPTIINCTLSSNTAGDKGGGLYNSGSKPTLTNCILWGNRDSGGTNEAAQTYGAPPVVNYCCIQGLTGGLGGTGNIDDDPNFGRDPNDGGDGWGVGDNDDFGDLHITPGSPCIDAGNNNAVPADAADLDGDGNTAEPTPRDFDGDPRFVDDPCTTDTGSGTKPVVDMGADEFPYLGDLDFSGCVNFADYALVAVRWLETGCGTCGGADLTGEGDVNLDDVRRFVRNWLAGCGP